MGPNRSPSYSMLLPFFSVTFQNTLADGEIIVEDCTHVSHRAWRDEADSCLEVLSPLVSFHSAWRCCAYYLSLWRIMVSTHCLNPFDFGLVLWLNLRPQVVPPKSQVQPSVFRQSIRNPTNSKNQKNKFIWSNLN